MDGKRISIKQELLRDLFKKTFSDSSTRVGKEAIGLCMEYLRIFIKEAIQRAQEGGEGGVLELEDFERVLPQLLMDFQ